jgi:hypothetical protein
MVTRKSNHKNNFAHTTPSNTIADLLIGVQMLLKEAFDLLFIIWQLFWADLTNILQKMCPDKNVNSMHSHLARMLKYGHLTSKQKEGKKS